MVWKEIYDLLFGTAPSENDRIVSATIDYDFGEDNKIFNILY